MPPPTQYASLEATTMSHLLCILLEKFSVLPSIFLTWWHLRVTNFRYCTLIQKKYLAQVQSRESLNSGTCKGNSGVSWQKPQSEATEKWLPEKLGKPGRYLVSWSSKLPTTTDVFCNLGQPLCWALGHSSDWSSHCPGPHTACPLGNKGHSLVTSPCSEPYRPCGNPVSCSGWLPPIGTLTN